MKVQLKGVERGKGSKKNLNGRGEDGVSESESESEGGSGRAVVQNQ